jgi:imidazolonepropionase-like amidohydrolase
MVQRSHPWGMLADGPEELRKAVRELNRMGSDAVKVWATGGGMWEKELETDQHYDLDELSAIVREASMLGMTVLAHAESLAAAKDALRAGVTTLEHGEELDDECRQIMVDRGIIHVPTLQLFLGPWFDEYPPPPRAGLEDYRGETMAEKEKNRVSDNFTATRKAGVVFAVGSDSFSSTTVPYGASTLEEVRTMVRIGTPPMDALVAATRNGARALRIDAITGTLETGKAADLIVLDANPLEDIAVLDPDRMLLIQRGTQTWKDETRD